MGSNAPRAPTARLTKGKLGVAQKALQPGEVVAGTRVYPFRYTRGVPVSGKLWNYVLYPGAYGPGWPACKCSQCLGRPGGGACRVSLVGSIRARSCKSVCLGRRGRIKEAMKASTRRVRRGGGLDPREGERARGWRVGERANRPRVLRQESPRVLRGGGVPLGAGVRR